MRVHVSGLCRRCAPSTCVHAFATVHSDAKNVLLRIERMWILLYSLCCLLELIVPINIQSMSLCVCRIWFDMTPSSHNANTQRKEEATLQPTRKQLLLRLSF